MIRRSLLLLLIFFLPLTSGAETEALNKQYWYDRIGVEITVNPDTTLDVTERQIFHYLGDFHQGWRQIPLTKIGSIDRVQVLDGTTNQPLVYSSRKLDKLDPVNWGKYTVYRQNGVENIEWYYNLADTTHEWVLRYRVHGALSFLPDKDELYWNLFTDYSVPVDVAEIRVVLPDNNFSTSQLQVTGYGEPISPTLTQILDNRTFFMQSGPVLAGEKLTIAAGWPRGLVDRGAFWRDWLWQNLYYLLSGLIVLVAIIYSALHWYYLEKKPEWSRTIVPEYEPPERLKPAMAEVVVKERVSERAWPATIIDLAVRGYVKIGDLGPSKVQIFLAWLTTILFVLPLAFSVFIIGWGGGVWFAFPLVLIILLVISRVLRATIKPAHNYAIYKVKDWQTAGDLEDYERQFLDLIFRSQDIVTTQELRRRARSRSYSSESFSQQMLELQTKLLVETGQDTQAYVVPLRSWNSAILIIPVVICIFASLGLSGGGLLTPPIVLTVAVVFALLLIWLERYNPRLSARGIKLKQDWLGFVLYLKTAEQLRLQNLTPDLFEKYLPYAIIFGLEKQWGRAFASLNMLPPDWYSAPVGLAGNGLVATSGFSPAAFSSSFASSFTSAFASSSGGASGGGGSAGGGGGGGGGGAS